MGAVIDQSDRIVRLSIARLAEEFGMARETVSKRLAQSNVAPDGKRMGYPVYRLRDACPALLEPGSLDEDGNPDPKALPPDKRNQWYQSENRRIDLEMRSKQLIPAAEVEAEMAEMARGIAQFLSVLPDELERDAGLSPEQVEAMHEAIERARMGLYERIIAEDAPEAAAG